MADAAELRRAFAAFLGESQYRKFIEQGVLRDRLRFWQEQAWERFVALRPEFDVDLNALAAALRVCHLHGDELQPDTVPVFRGNVDWAQPFIEVRNRLFPRSAQDVFSTEGRPFELDRVEVWFCPSCRAARAAWESRQRRRRP